MSKKQTMSASPQDNITIVLVGTRYPGNIGSVARAMWNMGFDHLRLARPVCAIDEESRRMARSGDVVLARARVHRSLEAALRGIRLTVGTTAKTGGYRRQAQPPRIMAPQIVAQAARQKVAIVFGPEDTGLVDQDLRLCNMLVRIPTHRRGRSINVAQSVMLLCYELYLAQSNLNVSQPLSLAPVEQLEAMYQQLQEALLEAGFLHSKNTDHMMLALRRLLGRAGLEDSDVAILRGIARQIAWHAKRAPRAEGNS
jgi:tRNA/rRNA methyltransferase